jgi:FKBP-type peptidyl-prolyl cis-trans isomerase
MFKSQLDSASYAFGFNISRDLKARGFKSLNYELVTKAMTDGFHGTDSLLTKEECQKVIVAALASASKEKYALVLAEGKKFLEENKKKPGVTTLPSGLQYEVLQAGTGEKPKASDQVTVHYKGTLINGKQFDSSYDRKEPATFSLSGVIPGWTEGVQLMPVGSKYHFVIPYELGYGERGAGQDIPPYSVLVFDVELIKIGK